MRAPHALALLALLALFGVGACAPETGRPLVELGLEAQGAGVASFEAGDITVRLERAEVVVGPLYVCATEAADIALCDVALAEWLDPFVVDALDPAAHAVGVMEGPAGEARTVAFDFGVSWYPTAAAPSADPALLEGRSAVFVGVAERGAEQARFEASVVLRPLSRGLVAVAGRPAAGTLRGGETLGVSVDAAAMLGAVDFEALLAEAAGGAEPVRIEPGHPAHSAIALRMTATAPPSFRWRAP